MNELKMIEYNPEPIKRDYLHPPLKFWFNSNASQALPLVRLHPNFIYRTRGGINIKPARKN